MVTDLTTIKKKTKMETTMQTIVTINVFWRTFNLMYFLQLFTYGSYVYHVQLKGPGPRPTTPPSGDVWQSCYRGHHPVALEESPGDPQEITHKMGTNTEMKW